MSWILLFTLAGIVFLNRYLFLDPQIPVRLPKIVREALRYSAPCLLTAICAPIILMHGTVLRSFPDNPYFWGAICSVMIALLVRHMVVSVLISILVFYLLVFLLSSG